MQADQLDRATKLYGTIWGANSDSRRDEYQDDTNNSNVKTAKETP